MADPNKPNSENARKLKFLLDVLRRVQAKVDDMRRLGRTIDSAASLAGEVAPASHDLMSLLSAGQLRSEDLDRQIEAWQDWLRSADELAKAATQRVSIFSATSSAVTNTMSTVASFISYSISPAAPEIETAKAKIDQILARSGFLEKVRAEMLRLGLDRRGGDDKSPRALLEDAAAGLGTSPSAALMPMRGSINATLGELLRRRQNREPTPKLKEKLNSIGTQCGRPGLAINHFDRLAVDGSILIDQLSKAKEGDLTKDQISSLFYRSLVFLYAFLSSLDETPLKP